MLPVSFFLDILFPFVSRFTFCFLLFPDEKRVNSVSASLLMKCYFLHSIPAILSYGAVIHRKSVFSMNREPGGMRHDARCCRHPSFVTMGATCAFCPSLSTVLEILKKRWNYLRERI